jgi:antitoxin component of MazEF toxin-antitoxin module
METKIAKIGNEFGLVLPKQMLDACGFGTDATVTVQNGTLLVKPSARKPREGWAAAIDAIPNDVLQRDYDEMTAFGEIPDAWEPRDWHRPDIHADATW